MVLTATKSISRVFRLTSSEGQNSLGQYQCNFDFIFDHRRHTLSYFRSNRCLQKYTLLTTPDTVLQLYDTIVFNDLHISKMAALPCKATEK